MPPLNYFVVESPEEVGRKAYERVAGDVLQDLDLIKVIDRLHIYVDPKIPIFIAAGVLHHMPRTIRVGDFANVNRGDTRIVRISVMRPILHRCSGSSGRFMARRTSSSLTGLP